MTISGVTALDLIALLWFLACWLGFDSYAKWRARKRPSLITAVGVFRRQWTERMCARDNHQSDATILGNLLRGAIFFSSTTMLILGGLVALLGTTPKVIEVATLRHGSVRRLDAEQQGSASHLSPPSPVWQADFLSPDKIAGNVMTKVLVLYYSSYGHIEKMADAVAQGAREAGAEVVDAYGSEACHEESSRCTDRY